MHNEQCMLINGTRMKETHKCTGKSCNSSKYESITNEQTNDLLKQRKKICITLLYIPPISLIPAKEC